MSKFNVNVFLVLKMLHNNVNIIDFLNKTLNGHEIINEFVCKIQPEYLTLKNELNEINE